MANHDLTTSNGVKAYMTESTSVDDFNVRVVAVQKANGGEYPPFWYMTIMVSGLAAQITAKFNDTKVVPVDDLGLVSYNR